LVKSDNFELDHGSARNFRAGHLNRSPIVLDRLCRAIRLYDADQLAYISCDNIKMCETDSGL